MYRLHYSFITCIDTFFSLNDEELEVRQCAVKMLSFLVLHEMVRVKGQIADMALCCADKDPGVASMTKLFFKQLSQKGNALYNVMPDIISRLSDPALAVPEDHYRVIMKLVSNFFFSFFFLETYTKIYYIMY